LGFCKYGDEILRSVSEKGGFLEYTYLGENWLLKMVFALLDSWRYVGKDEKQKQLAWLHNRQSKILSTFINREHQIKHEWVVMIDKLLWKCILFMNE
jgi:hypothetical protein